MMVQDEAARSCSYELDEHFRVVSVDPLWIALAEENGAPELVPPAPYNRTIWSYISDATTAHLWRQIFDKVLRTGTPVIVPIRCDSPTARRFVELVVSRRPESGLRVECTLVRSEDRSEPLSFELDRAHHEMMRMCSWCGRTLVEGEWVEIELLVMNTRLFERRTAPSITHGMCPDCHRAVNALLGDGV